jgi:uncharacterized protein (DUF1810 family)
MEGQPAFDLERYVSAQEDVFTPALEELRSGRKRTHWMWFVFPQLRGLGSSALADRYGLSGLDEARAYLDHPLLGPRLTDCLTALEPFKDRPLRSIFGPPDDLKFRSCLTLFDAAAPRGIFAANLERFCGGGRDQETLRLLAASNHD